MFEQHNERKCRICGCTQNHACPGGCYWVEDDLCSQCAVCELCDHNGKDYDIYKCETCGKLVCEDCGESLNDGDSFFCKECLSKMKKRDCSKCRNQNSDNCPFNGEYSYCYDCEEYEISDIARLIEEAHKNAVDHGWWEEPKSFGELIALIHTELSEALEEHRNHIDPKLTYYSGSHDTEAGTLIIKSPYPVPEASKPEGIPSELADVVIRVFDICGYYGINLEAAIKEKMEYNKTRPYKHGGKKL
jgi:NTP pyrophosphatase (non-canonical NTP hydrolase)